MAYPQDYLYEILVRGRPDGSFAAHQITTTIVAEGVERAGSPAPLDLAQVAAVLGAAFPGLATRLDAATADVAAKAARIGELETQAAGHAAQVDAFNMQIATLNAEIDVLRNPPADAVLSCTDLQFRLALNQLGLRESVEAYAATASQDVRDWWERATTIHADNAMLIEAASALGKTQADIDAVISLGKTLA